MSNGFFIDREYRSPPQIHAKEGQRLEVRWTVRALLALVKLNNGPLQRWGQVASLGNSEHLTSLRDSRLRIVMSTWGSARKLAPPQAIKRRRVATGAQSLPVPSDEAGD